MRTILGFIGNALLVFMVIVALCTPIMGGLFVVMFVAEVVNAEAWETTEQIGLFALGFGAHSALYYLIVTHIGIKIV